MPPARDRLKAIEEAVERIERCLTGDEKMGQFGLVQRANNHASRIKRLERYALYMIGAGGLATVIYHVAVDAYFKK